jgi:hypothetical protein
MKEADVSYPVLYMPADTHNFPEKMRETLQMIIDQLTDIDYLLLPMGRCGNGTVGLKSDRFSLVLPKCEDCINLLLSKDSLKVERPKGSMFFTEGWLRSSLAADSEYDRTIARYGKEQGEAIMQMIYGGYRRFSLLDTGLYDLHRIRERLQPLACCASLTFTEIPASYGVLKKMVSLNFENENFVIVPPGTAVTEEMLK